MTGTILRVLAKGFAFVATAETRDEIFLHRSQWLSEQPFDLKLIGKQIDFTLKHDDKGRPEATGARLIGN